MKNRVTCNTLQETGDFFVEDPRFVRRNPAYYFSAGYIKNRYQADIQPASDK
jgi:hypothetical protein